MDGERQHRHGGERWPREPAQQRARRQAIDDAAQVGRPPRPTGERRDHEERRQRQHEQAVGDDGRPHEGEPVELAPGQAAPQVPHRDPVERTELRGEAGADQRGEGDPVDGEAVAHERVQQRHERRPDDQRRRQQAAEHQREHRQFEADCEPGRRLLPQQHRADGERGAGDDHERQHGVGEHLAREHRRGGHRGGAVDGVHPAALLADEALDGVEEQQQAEQQRQRLEHAGRRRAGRHQRLGVEGALAEAQRAPCLQQDDRAEQPDAGRAQQRACLGGEHVPRRRQESGRARRAGGHGPARSERSGRVGAAPRGVGRRLRQQRRRLADAQVVVAIAREPPAGGPHRQQADGDEGEAAGEERRVRRERGRVVEGDAAVLLDEVAQHPPQPRRVGELEQFVDPRRQPHRLEVPDEEQAADDEDYRQREDEHRLPRAHAEPARDAADEDRSRQHGDQQRLQVVPRGERAADLLVRVERHEFVERDLHDQPGPQDRGEHGQRRREAAEGVADVRDRRGVDQPVDTPVGVGQRRHAEQHGDEERQDQAEQQEVGEDEVERRVDRQLGAAGVGAARADLHVAEHEAERHQAEDGEHHDVQWTAVDAAQLQQRQREEARDHAAPPARATAALRASAGGISSAGQRISTR